MSERAPSVVPAITLVCWEGAAVYLTPRPPVHRYPFTSIPSEGGDEMGYTKDQYVAAAKVPPSKRTAEQQAMVSKGSNLQEVRNADFEAKRRDR